MVAALLVAPIYPQEIPTAEEELATMLRLTTNHGEILIELLPEQAPESVATIAAYAAEGQYDGNIFHRVIPGFMIQGGGFTDKMMEVAVTKPLIQNESNNGLSNTRGTVALARRNDPHSASRQFFINLGNNDNLDFQAPNGWGYAVFGKVVEGMGVVDSIAKVRTGRHGGHGDVPKTPVLIEKAELLTPSSGSEDASPDA